MTQESETESAPDTGEHDDIKYPVLCRAPAYPYRQLHGDEFRLLKILPGNGIVECVLHQVDFERSEDFIALSYVWGNASETKQILLEGQPFKVTRNLYAFLHELREQNNRGLAFMSPDTYYWADAICLDQHNIEEKSHQVPRMIDIYYCTLRVIIWLGPNRSITKSAKGSKAAVVSSFDASEFIHRDQSADNIVELLFQKAESLGRGWELPDNVEEEESVFRETFGESYGAVLIAAAELLRRPWFTRVWTVQEYSLRADSSFLAGRHGVNAYMLLFLLRKLANHHRIIALTDGYKRISSLDTMNSLWTGKYDFGDRELEPEIPAAECLLEIRSLLTSSAATDPRDQLYALLGLVKQFIGKDLPTEMKPDYSLPCDIVYWQFAAYLLQETGDLGLLLTRYGWWKGIPSWVPDFRTLGLNLKASERAKSIVRVSPDKRTIHLEGIRMEHICDIVHEWSEYRKFDTSLLLDLQYRIRYVEGRIFKPASQIRCATLDDILDDFLRHFLRLFRDGGSDGMRRAYTNLRRPSGRSLSRRRREKTEDSYGKDYCIADAMKYPFVLLDDGTILCVQRTGIEILPDDIVCIFKGTREPIIIRPSEESDTFTLVGHCMISFGTFYGQSFEEDFWTGKQREEFRLA
ncbi:heterokaryon incompatibility protein-domain-containing protein [Nemania sp. FL0916]|nr:heterokaryon incompatibility protein-domain-containing protein [Nemania sp. FL0916]